MSSTASGKSEFLSRFLANSPGHAGHRDRLRARAQMGGAESLKPHELIELLLFYAIPRRNVNALAHALIERFGSANGVLTADEKALREVEGVGAHTARVLCEIGRLCRAYADLRAEDRPLLVSLAAFRDFVLRHRAVVEGNGTWQFCLSYEGRLLLARPIAASSAWAQRECLREAMEDVITSHAYGVLLAQYTDVPCPRPSDYDRRGMQSYNELLVSLNAQLMDHLLVGTREVYSMRRNDDLQQNFLPGRAGLLGERYLGDELSPKAPRRTK